jgi:hypothetical protein
MGQKIIEIEKKISNSSSIKTTIGFYFILIQLNSKISGITKSWTNFLIIWKRDEILIIREYMKKNKFKIKIWN